MEVAGHCWRLHWTLMALRGVAGCPGRCPRVLEVVVAFAGACWMLRRRFPHRSSMNVACGSQWGMCCGLQGAMGALAIGEIPSPPFPPHHLLNRNRDLQRKVRRVRESRGGPLYLIPSTLQLAPVCVPPFTASPQKALIVGINYLTWSQGKLGGCINDANNMYTLLTTHFGFPETNVLKLTDDAEDPSLMPTTANIRKGFEWLFRDAQAGDVLFFHYSGHGSQVWHLGKTCTMHQFQKVTFGDLGTFENGERKRWESGNLG